MTSSERQLAVQNREKMGEYLGILGLHDQRYFNMHADLRLCTTAVSGSELEKIAARAEHLVELEKLIYEWDPESFKPLVGPILEWASKHDFSFVAPKELKEESDVHTVQAGPHGRPPGRRSTGV